MPTARSQAELEKQMQEYQDRIAAILEETKRSTERALKAYGEMPRDLYAEIEAKAREPAPYTATTFFKAIWNKLPNRWQVGYAVAALFQLYLAHRAVMLGVMQQRPMLCSDIPDTTLRDSFLGGMFQDADRAAEHEQNLERYQNCVHESPDPSACLAYEASVDANRSVVDAVFAKEARRRKAQA